MNLNSTDILCYHKVYRENQRIPDFHEDGLSLNETEFESHLIYLKKHYNILNLKYGNIEEKAGKRKLVLTFDDGTRDIQEVILPIIEKHNIPIVIFISSSFVEDNSVGCWFIDLWENIRNRSSIIITINQRTKFFKTKSSLQKNISYRKIHKILFKMSRVEQVEFFTQNNLKTNYNKYFLNENDLIKLADHPLITMGFHSHYHLNYSIENLSIIENDIDIMLRFFKKLNIEPFSRMFAFCYGIPSQVFLNSQLASHFELYFTLGFKSMLFNKSKHIFSRIDVSGKTLNQLKFKLKLLRVVKFFSYILNRGQNV